MKKILFIALAFLATVGIAKATLWDFYNGNMPTIKERQPEAKICGISDYSGEYDQNIIFEKCLRSGVNYGELSLGGTLPVAGSTYSLAGSGVSSSATSITLQSFTIPQSGQKILDSDLSDTFYATLEPGSRTRQEIVACTTVTQNSGGTATLSGCSRGMSPITPYTASTTLAFVHAGGSQVILSDPPQLFNEFTAKSNAETVTGIWTFNNLPKASTVTTLATTSDQFATKYYVDNVGAGGFTASNVGTNYGLKALGTSPETVGIDLASLSGLRFDNAYNLQVATSTYSGLTIDTDNVMKVATSSDFTWTGNHTFATSTLTNATSTNSLDIEGKLCFDGDDDCISSGSIAQGSDNSHWQFSITPLEDDSALTNITIQELGGYSLLTNSNTNGSVIYYFPQLYGADQKIQMDRTKDLKVKTMMKHGNLIGQWGFGCAEKDHLNFFYDYDYNLTDAAFIGFTATGTELYARVSTGAGASNNSTSTVISDITLTDWNTYAFDWDAGNNAKFYVNGVLKATLTTGLPTIADDGYCGIGSSSNGDQVYMTSIKLDYEL